MVKATTGNSHVTRDQLFNSVDGYYSLNYPTTRGNVRSFFKYCSAGVRLDTPIADFRLKRRTEMVINWFRLTSDGLVAVLGKFTFSYRVKSDYHTVL